MLTKGLGRGRGIQPVSTEAVSNYSHCFYLPRLNSHFLLFVHSLQLLKLPICLDTVLVMKQLTTSAWSTTLAKPTSQSAASSRDHHETTPLPCQSRWAVKIMFHCLVFFSRWCTRLPRKCRSSCSSFTLALWRNITLVLSIRCLAYQYSIPWFRLFYLPWIPSPYVKCHHYQWEGPRSCKPMKSPSHSLLGAQKQFSVSHSRTRRIESDCCSFSSNVCSLRHSTKTSLSNFSGVEACL